MPSLCEEVRAAGRYCYVTTYHDGVTPIKTALLFRTSEHAEECARRLRSSFGAPVPAPSEPPAGLTRGVPEAPRRAEQREMTDAETAAHLRRYVTEQHGSFSWPTDACGYEQHIRFVQHRNANWYAAHGGGETFDQFVLAYADSLDGGAAAARVPEGKPAWELCERCLSDGDYTAKANCPDCRGTGRTPSGEGR